MRGLAVVLIFTPWFAGEGVTGEGLTGEGATGETSEFYAPAILVLLFDILLEGTKNGIKGGVALLVATFSMLLVITVRQYLRHKPKAV